MKRKLLAGVILILLATAAIQFIYVLPADVKANTGPPEENRFQKNILLSGLDEPMELAVLPNGNVLFIERKGALKLYRHREGQAMQLAKLNVFHDLEDGLLGLALDPAFRKNEWIYLFYSPAGEKAIQRVSRFKLSRAERFEAESEKILLEIPTQRTECCHSAGSLAFGPDNNLYVAVGDNTNPHNPGYYNSIDERSGREYWDAQRTAANTNDLRGKILRIRPEAEGTYSIPKGNLFPKDGSGGKPEIYVMGCRNPYRITVDQETNHLYWGDVGQNTEDNPARGPISYDEFHQAKGPGFFGWPYFAGDNQPYADFDFATEEIGTFFDPQRPVNESRNNTGARILPAAQPAFIWYSYDSSKHFEYLGTGGKSPIIGPVYYSDHYKDQPAWVQQSRKFPEYFDGKLFIAEWMRDWINVVTMDENSNLTRIDPFMPSSNFAHPIELEFGPDGALYILEYGTLWFSENKDAKLVRIDYHAGNRAPVAVITAEKSAGAAPMTVNFSAERSYDYDQPNGLRYSWILDPENKTEASGPTAQHTFKMPGLYKVTLTATDNEGERSVTEIDIRVGNELAEITLETDGNRSFYQPGKAFTYRVLVNDKEDGSVGNGILQEDVLVTLTYLPHDQPIIKNTSAEPTQFFGGLELINQSDCKACHHQTETSVGPSYEKISARYVQEPDAREVLATKIIKGGSGNWGETAMSAHPQLTEHEAGEMVKYILSLGSPDVDNRMPLKGSIMTGKDTTGNYLLHVTYEDRGGESIGPLLSRKTFVIRNPKINVLNFDDNQHVSKVDGEVVKFTQSEAFIAYKDIDLSNVTVVSYTVSPEVNGRIELHLDSPSGAIVSVADFKPEAEKDQSGTMTKQTPEKNTRSNIKPTSGTHDLYFVYKDTGKQNAETSKILDLRSIQFH